GDPDIEITPWNNQALFVHNDRGNAGTPQKIEALDSSTFARAVLYVGQNKITSLASSPDFRWIAWVEKGQVHLLQGESHHLSKPTFEQFNPESLTFSGTQTLVVH